MSKNIPITTRVNRGLFSQKKSPVQEPLLSVGVAGVYGNNETRNIPAPSKLMSSPAKQVSGSKSTGKIILEQVVAKSGTQGTTETITVPGATTTTNKKVKKPYVGAAKDACSPEYIAKNGRRACDEYKALSAEKKEAGNTTTVPTTTKEPDATNTIDKPGEKVELRIFHEGDAMTTFGRRQLDRSIIQGARKTKRAEIDVAKAKAKAGKMGNDAEGNPITDKNKFISEAKNAARLKQAETKAAGIGANTENSVLQGQQSKSPGNKFLGTQLDQSKEQKKDASLSNSTTVADDAAQTNAILGQPPVGNPNPAKSISTSTPPVTKATGSGDPVATDVVADVKKEDKPKDAKSAALYKKPAFFDKRGPLKMKYFK